MGLVSLNKEHNNCQWEDCNKKARWVTTAHRKDSLKCDALSCDDHQGKVEAALWRIFDPWYVTNRSVTPFWHTNATW